MLHLFLKHKQWVQKKKVLQKGKQKAFFEANGESGNLLKICVFWIVLGKKRIGGKIVSWFSVI